MAQNTPCETLCRPFHNGLTRDPPLRRPHLGIDRRQQHSIHPVVQARRLTIAFWHHGERPAVGTGQYRIRHLFWAHIFDTDYTQLDRRVIAVIRHEARWRIALDTCQILLGYIGVHTQMRAVDDISQTSFLTDPLSRPKIGAVDDPASHGALQSQRRLALVQAGQSCSGLSELGAQHAFECEVIC